MQNYYVRAMAYRLFCSIIETLLVTYNSNAKNCKSTNFRELT